MSTKTVLSSVLERITPSSEQQRSVKKVVTAFCEKLKKRLKKKKISAKIIPGGSFAKKTWLSSTFDIDIFVQFTSAHKNDNLSNLLEKTLPRPYDRIHGSRDYFQLKKGKLLLEIVPVLAVPKTGSAQNVTDYSPHHVSWTTKKGKGLQDDILLAKQFFKANNIYGAESHIQGFSGHVVDLLIIKYKGFLPLLRAVSNWKNKTIIDIENVYKGRALHYLNRSKTEGPLVIVDPIQSDRNAAAAVHKKNVEQLQEVAVAFLKKPSEDFFIEKKKDLSKLGKHSILMEIVPLKGKRDVIGSKIKKVFITVKKALEDFGIKSSGWEWNGKAVFWYDLKMIKLSPTVEHKGPPITMKEAIVAFKKKHKNTVVKKGNIYATVKRKHTTTKTALEEILTSKYVKSKVKKIIKKN